tara:strand:- start:78716 stop:79783 length:1068 start_codon:yes stop_codon:yes gene_type:complete
MSDENKKQQKIANSFSRYAQRILPRTEYSDKALADLEQGYEDLLQQGLLSELEVMLVEGAQEDSSIRACAIDRIIGAKIDPLTRLPNKPFFDQYMLKVMKNISENFEAYKEDGLDVAILFSDLNSFKEINDIHGHATGDMVLQHLAEVWRGVVRNQMSDHDAFSSSEHRSLNDIENRALMGRDFLSRWAGDEFAVIVPYPVNEISTDDISQRFKDALALKSYQVKYENGAAEEISLQASIGSLSIVNEMDKYLQEHDKQAADLCGDDFDQLRQRILEAVDRNMYAAKREMKKHKFNLATQAVVLGEGLEWQQVMDYQAQLSANSAALQGIACDASVDDDGGVSISLQYSEVFQPK